MIKIGDVVQTKSFSGIVVRIEETIAFVRCLSSSVVRGFSTDNLSVVNLDFYQV